MGEPAKGRWVVDDDSTVWWEFGVGEAMEPEEALHNHVDNNQFNAAYDALVELIATADLEATTAVARRLLDSWDPFEEEGAWVQVSYCQSGDPSERAVEPMTPAERRALEALEES